MRVLTLSLFPPYEVSMLEARKLWGLQGEVDDPNGW